MEMEEDFYLNTSFSRENSTSSRAGTRETFGVCGLQNLGNTCYMNASLQAMSNCPHITEFFLQCYDTLNKRTILNLSSCYHDFLVRLWNSQNSGYIAPLALVRKIQFLFPMFSGFGQHDAQEFLRVFLNQLHEEMFLTPPAMTFSLDVSGRGDQPAASQLSVDRRSLAYKCARGGGVGLHTKSKRCKPSRTASSVDTCHTCQASSSLSNNCSKQAQEPDAKPGSIVTDVFHGKLTSAVQCLSCKKLSTRKEIFLDISLSLHRTNSDSSRLSASDPLLVSRSGGAGDGTAGYFRPSSLLGNLARSVGVCAAKPSLTTEECEPCKGSTSPLLSKPVVVTAGAGATQAKQSNGSGMGHVTGAYSKPDRAPLCNWDTGGGACQSDSGTGGRQNNHREARRTLPSPAMVVGYPIPLLRRLLFNIFSIVSLSISWLLNRLWDIRSWISQPKITLEDCLSDYFSHVELSGENKYYCDGCKKLCDGLNQYSILSLPEVLCIHLKRFRSNYMDTSKVSSRVTFPLHGLELRPYLHDDCSDVVTSYDLMSIICHRGGYGGGHYVAYALNRYTQTWYEYDDDSVSEVSPDQVERMAKDVYVLLYRKCDDWLVPLRKYAKMQIEQFLESEHLQDCVYISRPWFVRFSTWAEPGPVSNQDYLCQHGRVSPQLCSDWRETFFPIPKSLGERLVGKFGGGPLIDSALPCSICQEAIRDRQGSEYTAFELLIEHCKPKWKYYAVYAVSSTWLNAWRDFVIGNSWTAPGPIDNTVLIDYCTPELYFGVGSKFVTTASSSATSANQQCPLRLKSDAAYENLVEPCWAFLHDIYGGQPELCIRQELPVEPPPVPSDDNDLVDGDPMTVNAEEEVRQPATEVCVNMSVDPEDCVVVDLQQQPAGEVSQSFCRQLAASREPAVGIILDDRTFSSPSAYRHCDSERTMGVASNLVSDASVGSDLVRSSGDSSGSLPQISRAADCHLSRPDTSPHALLNGLPSSSARALQPGEKLVPQNDHHYTNGLTSLWASGDSLSSLDCADTPPSPLLVYSGYPVYCSSSSGSLDDGEEEEEGAAARLLAGVRKQTPFCREQPQQQHRSTCPACSDPCCCYCGGADQGTGRATASMSSAYAVNGGAGGTSQLRKRPHLLRNG